MKTTIKFIGLFLLLTSGQFASGQREEKLFFNKKWKICCESRATYYRILSFGNNGEPTGKAMDYLITGELLSEVDRTLSIDYNNYKNPGPVTKSIGYYKSGEKKFERFSDLQGKELSNTFWYENGNKKSEAQFKNGRPDGLCTSYYENGKLQFKQEFKDGKPADSWLTDCNDSDKCQIVFLEEFKSAVDENGWEPADLHDFKSQIIPGKGLMVKTKTNNGFAKLIPLEINISNNFSIETIINFKAGAKTSAQGLIYGHKDWDNYCYFYLSANGYYRIGVISDGFIFEYAKWTQSDYINRDYAINIITINKTDNKIFFSINGQTVASRDFHSYKGNNIGFYIPSGKKEVLFERLLVRQDIIQNKTLAKSSGDN